MQFNLSHQPRQNKRFLAEEHIANVTTRGDKDFDYEAWVEIFNRGSTDGCDAPAGPRYLFNEGETCITLINATPYRWRLGFTHAYQVAEWDFRWPEYIDPGRSVPFWVKNRHAGYFDQDSAAEAVYHIEATDEEPMSFRVQYRKGHRHRPYVTFLEGLRAAGRPRGSEISLGMRSFPRGAAFVLAGRAGHFAANEPPVGWMRAERPWIGGLPLRSVALPRSHDTGITKRGRLFGLASYDNAATQVEDSLYAQLRDGGVRVVDVRAVLSMGEMRTAHGMRTPGYVWHGILGPRIADMVADTNRFNAEFPGELIIWDLHDADAWDRDRRWRGFTHDNRVRLFDVLKRLEHRVRVNVSTDVTSMPLDAFIGGNTSAVMILSNWHNVDERSAAAWPGHTEGFFHRAEFPRRQHWSEMWHERRMMDNQVAKLRQNRPARDSSLYDLQAVVTPQGLNLIGGMSIIEEAGKVWRRVHHDLWNAMTVHTYPNWISMDAIQGPEFRTLIVAINRCFVGKACGDWAEKERMTKHANSQYPN
jgi:hypothetical protein